MTAAAWNALASLQVAAKPSTSTSLLRTAAPYAVPIPLVFMFSIPLLYLLMTRCCIPPRGWHDRVKQALLWIDIFGLNHDVPPGESPTMRKTTLGGGVTVLAFGTIAGVAASLIANYVLNNLKQQQPVHAPVTNDYATLRSSGVSAPHWSGTTSGVRLELHTMGPFCHTVDATTSSLLGNASFSYSRETNATTAHSRHVFDCPTCAFTATSTLDVWLHSSCQTLLVHAFAVNTAGAVTAASFRAASACPSALDSCPRLSSAAVAFGLTLDVFDDGVNAQPRRGFAVAPTAALPPDNSDPAVVTLRVTFPLNPFYVVQQLKPEQTATELASAIIGLSGLLGAFGSALVVLETHVVPRCGRSGRATKAIATSSPPNNGDGGAANGDAADLAYPETPNPLSAPPDRCASFGAATKGSHAAAVVLPHSSASSPRAGASSPSFGRRSPPQQQQASEPEAGFVASRRMSAAV